MAYERTNVEQMAERTDKVSKLLDAGYSNKQIIEEMGISYYQLISCLRKLGVYADRVKSVDRRTNEERGVLVNTVESYIEAKLTTYDPVNKPKTKKFTDTDGKTYTDVSQFFGL